MRAGFAVFFVSLLGLLYGAQAQDSDPMSLRLSAEKVGGIEPGSYSAGDNVNFSLEPYGDKYLLRFAGSPECFVLAGDRVSLGGRVLKYDTGATALHISVWGGMTLYTEEAPAGLPATRTGDFVAPSRAAVSKVEMNAALGDEAAHLFYVLQTHLRFSVGAAVLAGSDDMRGLAFDALVNAEAGIERMLANPASRRAFAGRIEAVKIVEGDKPGIALSGKTLLISFAPSQGQAGRHSSRAVAQALGKMLAVSKPG